MPALVGWTMSVLQRLVRRRPRPTTRQRAPQRERLAPARDALGARRATLSGRSSTCTCRPERAWRWSGRATPTTSRSRDFARRAARVDLIDLDRRAALAVRRREPAELRGRIRAITEDVTDGCADSIAAATASRRRVSGCLPDPQPLGTADYDLVVGDLLYSQILYPALKDLELPEPRIGAILREFGDTFTDRVVRRLHLSASSGRVVHLRDLWDGHKRPLELEEVLDATNTTSAPRSLVARGNGPTACDPRASLGRIGALVLETRLWRWPFQEGVDYVVCASVAVSPAWMLLHPAR